MFRPKVSNFLVAWMLLMAGAASSAADSGLYAWVAPTAQEQLENDSTVIPAGKGALFVPTLTSSAIEPRVQIFRGDEPVASSPTGRRIILDPGSYTVRVGNGTLRQMVSTEVIVREGATESVTPNWGGLRVEVVDKGNVPHRGTYELIRIDNREVIGTGYGADTLQSESLQTWLLKPGLYRIVRATETYRARSNFATLDVPEGGLVHFKLVTDPATGDFQGAGIVLGSEFVVAEGEGDSDQVWTPRIALGGALSLSSTRDVVGQPNQDVFSGTVFFDTNVTYKNGRHLGTGIFELEEGLVRVDPAEGNSLPAQKAQDRLRIDVVYSYSFNDRIGPYGRFGLLTNVFASDVLATEDTTVGFQRLDGSRDVFFVPANSDYRTADAFGSLRVREGAGLNVKLIQDRRVTVNWRIGLGLRQNLFRNAFVLKNDSATPELDFFELDDFSEEGLETTLAATVHLGRYLLYTTDLEVFGDFGDLGNPTIDWRNTLSLRLAKFASLDYTLDVLRIPQVLDENQITQNLLLRFSFNLL